MVLYHQNRVLFHGIWPDIYSNMSGLIDWLLVYLLSPGGVLNESWPWLVQSFTFYRCIHYVFLLQRMFLLSQAKLEHSGQMTFFNWSFTSHMDRLLLPWVNDVGMLLSYSLHVVLETMATKWSFSLQQVKAFFIENRFFSCEQSLSLKADKLYENVPWYNWCMKIGTFLLSEEDPFQMSQALSLESFWYKLYCIKQTGLIMYTNEALYQSVRDIQSCASLLNVKKEGWNHSYWFSLYEYGPFSISQILIQITRTLSEI